MICDHLDVGMQSSIKKMLQAKIFHQQKMLQAKMFPHGLISSTTWCLPGPCTCYTLKAAQGPWGCRGQQHTSFEVPYRKEYMNSLSVEDRWGRSRNGSCSLHKSRRVKTGKNASPVVLETKMIPTHVETWICDLRPPVANHKSSMYFHVLGNHKFCDLLWVFNS